MYKIKVRVAKFLSASTSGEILDALFSKSSFEIVENCPLVLVKWYHTIVRCLGLNLTQ